MTTTAPDFGVDVSCGPDGLDPAGRLVSGLVRRQQAIARRLSTPRGRVLDAPNYGIDLRSFLSAGIDASAGSPVLVRVRGAVVAEISKFEWVQSVTATVTYDFATRIMKVSIQVETADGPFELVLAVSKVTVEILNGGGA